MKLYASPVFKQVPSIPIPSYIIHLFPLLNFDTQHSFSWTKKATCPIMVGWHKTKSTFRQQSKVPKLTVHIFTYTFVLVFRVSVVVIPLHCHSRSALPRLLLLPPLFISVCFLRTSSPLFQSRCSAIYVVQFFSIDLVQERARTTIMSTID